MRLHGKQQRKTNLFFLLSTEDLHQYLKNLNLVKPKRLYLSSSKDKNVVSFSELANQSVASVKPLAKASNSEMNVNVDMPAENCSHLLVDHTEVSQIAANGKYITTLM